ncbi:DNA-binding CsgD family transcriptional regulator [Mycobacterium sp. OAE908]|uniref:helix-turn-helix transcriptional regulator n=1 Tax=Mycobacterium sp. OAE908 TaxID=2817899 RepID=UPI0034E1BFEE
MTSVDGPAERRPRTPTPSMPIRGRAPEIDVIKSLISSLHQGCGGVLVVEGSPGIGKTRLMAEAKVIAEAAGMRVLVGQAFEYQQTVPFFALFTATVYADPPVGDPDALRRLGNSPDLHYWVVHDLRTAIRAAAGNTPMVILLEDIHWADTGTLMALRALTAIPHESPLLWILSSRTGAGGPAVADTLGELERRGARFVRLSPIGREGVIDIVEDAVRARADVSLLRLAGKAHGNPFLITELLGGLLEETRLHVARGCAVAHGDNLPRRLSTNMSQRLDALSDETKEVIQIAAVLPERFTAALLAQMLDRRPAALMSAIEEAVRADLLVEDEDQLRFRHDLLRDATRQSLPTSLLRAIERQSVTVMLQMGAAPAEVATQLARSADVGDQAAIATLREAARCVAASDKSAAAELSRRALELLAGDDPQRGSLVAETVWLLNHSARCQEAEELAAAMLAQLSPEDQAKARLRIPAPGDSLETRVSENQRALQLKSISDVTRSRHQAWLLCNHAVSGLPADEAIIAPAVAAAAATDDTETRVITEISLAILDYVHGQPLRALQRFEDLDPPARNDDPSFALVLAGVHRCNVLCFIGRADDAAALALPGFEVAQQDCSDVATALWALKVAAIHFAAGHLATARRTLERVAAPLWGATSEMSMNRWLILAEVAAHTGDRESLQEAVVAVRAANPHGATLVSRGAAYVLALAAWHCGDVHEAAHWLSRDGGEVLNPLWPNAFDRLISTARVAVSTGDAWLRARVLSSLELLAPSSEDIPIFQAVTGYARGILECDGAALACAAAALRAYRPLLSASATEDAGVALASVGRNAAAVDQFNTSFDAFVECEAAADAHRVARRLRSMGVVRRVQARRDKTGWDSLTDAEMRVVNLIANGATNSDVAKQLHLSPHTVKSHVRNAFTKLGINSRGQLRNHPTGDVAAR